MCEKKLYDVIKKSLLREQKLVGAREKEYTNNSLNV